MKIGQEITQEQSAELRAAITSAAPEGSEAHQLLTGISSSVWDALLQALLTQLTTKLQDPAFLQSIVTAILGIFTKKA